MLHGVLFVLTLHLAPCLQKWCFSSPACMRSSLQWYACDNIWPQKDVEGCHGMKFPVLLFVPLRPSYSFGRQWAGDKSGSVWRRHLSQQACRKMLKTALQNPRWFTNVCYRVSLMALHSESALSVCKAALCRNNIVQGRLGPLRAEYPSLHAPGLLNLVSQRLQDNVYNTEPSCQVTSMWLKQHLAA